MIVLGLTGSIATGKSTVAGMLKRQGFAHHDADSSVHQLMGPGGQAVAKIARRFETALEGDAINRKALGSLVFADKQALKDLEAILHPMIHAMTKAAMLQAFRSGRRGIVLDVPLLFETGANRRCDWTISVDCPALVQRQRYMQRPGAEAEKLKGILARQMPMADKRKRADFVLPTGQNKAATQRRLALILAKIDTSAPIRPKAWPLSVYRNPSLAGSLHSRA